MDANELARRLGLDDVPAVLSELLGIVREYDAPAEDLFLWMLYRSAFFEEQDRPIDHLDDPETLLEAARDEFGAVW